MLFAVSFFLNKIYIITLSSKDRVINVPALGNSFSVIFIHSSEKQPWENQFRIERNKLVLSVMKVASIGPGVPSNVEEGWTVRIKDGYIEYGNVNKKYDYLDIKVSRISPHYLEVGNRKYNLVEMFKDGEVIRIRARKFIY